MSEESKPRFDQIAKFGDALLAADRALASKLSESVKGLNLDMSRFLPDRTELYTPPTASERNGYQSAGVLVKRMAETVQAWRKAAPADSQPVVLALLQGGNHIVVEQLSEESFHALRIDGSMDGTQCMLLTHQSSVQLLCILAKVENESERRRIGFVFDAVRMEA